MACNSYKTSTKNWFLFWQTKPTIIKKQEIKTKNPNQKLNNAFYIPAIQKISGTKPNGFFRRLRCSRLCWTNINLRDFGYIHTNMQTYSTFHTDFSWKSMMYREKVFIKMSQSEICSETLQLTCIKPVHCSQLVWLCSQRRAREIETVRERGVLAVDSSLSCAIRRTRECDWNVCERRKCAERSSCEKHNTCVSILHWLELGDTSVQGQHTAADEVQLIFFFFLLYDANFWVLTSRTWT